MALQSETWLPPATLRRGAGPGHDEPLPALRGPNYKAVLEQATAAASGTPQHLAKRAQDYNLLIG